MRESTIQDLFVWSTAPLRPSTTAIDLTRSGSSLSLRSSSSVFDIDTNDDDVQDLETVSGAKEVRLLKKMEKAQRRLHASKSEMELNKRKQRHDEIGVLWRLEGELQAASGVAGGNAPPRRMRKDFRVTNLTSDIPGAQPRDMCGRTSSGCVVDMNAKRDYPYTREGRAVVKDDEQLFETPDARLPPRRLPPHLAQIMLETAGIARDHSREIKTYGLCTFEERVYRQSAVEVHLSTPGVGLRANRRPLVPLIEPPPLVERLVTVPANSLHFHPELKDFKPSHTSLSSHVEPPRLVARPRTNPPVRRPASDFAVPEHEGAADKSLNTADIEGARARRLVAATNRRPLGYAESPWARTRDES